jgi:hypothetical protein
MDRLIIFLGPGLMAGSPGATDNPALVTMPTPSPALKMISLPSWKEAAAITMTPLVTSGSSPASLRIPTLASSPFFSRSTTGKQTRPPSGNSISTSGFPNLPKRSKAAALAAAAAHVPVVKPERRELISSP